LQGGKVPLEILVRGKDAEENIKQFQKCAEIVKNAAVSQMIEICWEESI
jgi:hypothetical protein